MDTFFVYSITIASDFLFFSHRQQMFFLMPFLLVSETLLGAVYGENVSMTGAAGVARTSNSHRHVFC